MPRVLCVDDSRSFAELLEVALELEPDIDFVGRSSDVPAALDQLATHDVDVVLMDYDLPGVDGIEGVRRVKSAKPDVRAVILTAHADLDLVVRAAASGADGFLTKDCSLDDLLDAVRRETTSLELSEETMSAVRERVRAEGRSSWGRWDPRLTERERDVLALLAEGLGPRAISRQLGISVHTSRGYVRNVLTKLGAHSQLEAVVIAARAGIINPVGATDRPA